MLPAPAYEKHDYCGGGPPRDHFPRYSKWGIAVPLLLATRTCSVIIPGPRVLTARKLQRLFNPVRVGLASEMSPAYTRSALL
jgi:hypothetical protein